MASVSSPSFTWPKTSGSEETPLGGPSELVAFLEREVEFWKWHSPNVVDACRQVTEKVSALSNATLRVARKVGQVEDEWGEDDCAEVTSLIQEAANAGLPLSSTRVAQDVATLQQSSPAVASWYLAYRLIPAVFFQVTDSTRNEAGRKFALSALSAATLLDSNLLQSGDTSASAGLQVQVDTLRGAATAVQKRADDAVAQLEEHARQSEDDCEQASTRRLELEAKLESQLSESKKKVEEFEDYYNRQLALLKPVEYWRMKRKRHQLVWGGLAVLCTLGFVGLCAAGYWLANDLGVWPDGNPVVIPQGDVSGQVGTPPQVTSVRLSYVALLVLAIGILVWPLRLLIRLFQREGHLRDDARHRETLTMTYLALLRDDSSHGSDEQRMLVLSHLFAPMGVDASDDGMPNSQLALLSTLLAGKSSKT